MSVAQDLSQKEGANEKELEYYRGKDITIVFDRYLCMGAGYCGELEAVFGTHDAPIYEPDAAPVEEIIATIKKCPSGALSYVVGEEHFENYYDNIRIVVEKDGPLNCQGEMTVIDDQDSDLLLPRTDHFTLCRCGGLLSSYGNGNYFGNPCNSIRNEWSAQSL